MEKKSMPPEDNRPTINLPGRKVRLNNDGSVTNYLPDGTVVFCSSIDTPYYVPTAPAGSQLTGILPPSQKE